MLLTGNPPPPQKFNGLEDLERFIHSKAYRGILGFRKVRIRPPRDGENQHIGEYREIRVFGYTPLGAGFHSRGEGGLITTRAKGVGLTFVDMSDGLEFRVGKKLNYLHKKITGHLLPCAAMMMQYNLDYEDGGIITISSTNIPNITVYVDWVAKANYSIENITVEQADNFLTAHTNGKVADVGDRFVINWQMDGTLTVEPGGITWPLPRGGVPGV